jgi:tricarballylate dehydrogenase
VAREAGASVLLLEAAPREWRGGNSMHTRNLRCMHDAPQDVLTEAYPEEEFWQDLLKVTAARPRTAGPPGDPRIVHLPRLDAPPRRALSAVAVGHAAPEPHQCVFHGRRQGAGQCLLPQRRGMLGVDMRYETPVQRLELEGGRFVAAITATAASRPKPAWWPVAALSPTANGCARPGARTSAANGRPTTS